MNQVEFFSFLLENTINGKIDWHVKTFDTGKDSRDGYRYFLGPIEEISELSFGNVTLMRNCFLIEDAFCCYSSDVKDIVEQIFDKMGQEHCILQKGYDCISQMICVNSTKEKED